MPYIKWAALPFILLLSCLANAYSSSKAGSLTSNNDYNVLIQESDLENPVKLEGGTLVAIIPPPFPFSDTSHTTMDSMDRLSITLQKSVNDIRDIFAQSLKACQWDKRMEGAHLSKHYDEMVTCAKKSNDEYLNNLSRLIHAYLDTYQSHYKNHTTNDLYHRQVASYHLMLVPFIQYHRELDSYISLHKILGFLLERNDFKKDTSLALGVRAQDPEVQSKIDGWLSNLANIEQSMQKIYQSNALVFQCIGNI